MPPPFSGRRTVGGAGAPLDGDVGDRHRGLHDVEAGALAVRVDHHLAEAQQHEVPVEGHRLEVRPRADPDRGPGRGRSDGLADGGVVAAVGAPDDAHGVPRGGVTVGVEPVAPLLGVRVHGGVGVVAVGGGRVAVAVVVARDRGLAGVLGRRLGVLGAAVLVAGAAHGARAEHHEPCSPPRHHSSAWAV
jgi:hypothetical protein